MSKKAKYYIDFDHGDTCIRSLPDDTDYGDADYGYYSTFTAAKKALTDYFLTTIWNYKDYLKSARKLKKEDIE